MYNDFRAELAAELKRAGAPAAEAQEILAGYDKEFEKLLSRGKSEFEIIVSFGEPADIAAELSNPDEVATDEERLRTNPLITAREDKKKPVKELSAGAKIVALCGLWAANAAGLAFILGLAGFILYSAVPYLWKSFAQFEAAETWGAFGMAVIGALIGLFLIFCALVMIRGAVRATRKYLNGGLPAKKSKA